MRRIIIFSVALMMIGSVLMAQDTITEITVKRIYIAKHPQDPEYPQFVIFSKNKDFQLGFGGYAKLVAAFDFNGIVKNYDFITYDIPIRDAGLDEKRLYFDAHQSRLYGEVLGHVKGTPLRIYIETDFYSDDYYPRLRHAYGQIGSFLVGQTWSTLMDLDASPNTIDFEGPNSAVSLRAAMLRYTYGASGPFRIQVAAEMPEVSITYDSPYTESYQYVPDIILNLKYGRKWGHLQIGGVIRTMSYNDTTNHKQYNIIGYGGTLSGVFNIGKRNKFMFQAAAGNGIAKYIQDISGRGLDAVTEQYKYKPNELKAVLAGGFYAAYQQYWTDKLNSSFIYGLTCLEDNVNTPGGLYKMGQYACVNLFWDVFPSLSVALEYLWGQRLDQHGNRGNANRINAMAQFTF